MCTTLSNSTPLFQKKKNYIKRCTTLCMFTTLFPNISKLYKFLCSFFVFNLFYKTSQNCTKLYLKQTLQQTLHNSTKLHNTQTTMYTLIHQYYNVFQKTLQNTCTKHAKHQHNSSKQLYKTLHNITTLHNKLYTTSHNFTQLNTIQGDSTQLFFSKTLQNSTRTLQNYTRLYKQFTKHVKTLQHSTQLFLANTKL